MVLNKGTHVLRTLLGEFQVNVMGTVFHFVELKVWIILGQNGNGFVTVSAQKGRHRSLDNEKGLLPNAPGHIGSQFRTNVPVVVELDPPIYG